MSICFHALTYWLFKAGFTSEHWLTRNGARLIANTANNILGQGEVVTPGEEHLIPAGWLFNIHKDGDQTVCHWGVSMGDGWAVAVNTTPAEREDTAVVFRNEGNNFYGEFTLTSSVEVCRYKYADVLGGAPVDVTLRKINPTTVNTFT